MVISLSFITACDLNHVRDWTCTACKYPLVADTVVHSTFSLDSTATQGFLALHHASQSIILAFRGTVDWQGVKQDFKFPFKHHTFLGEGVHLHRGFYASYMAVRDLFPHNVMHILKEYPNYGIYTTGHSMGGALAGIAALDL